VALRSPADACTPTLLINAGVTLMVVSALALELGGWRHGDGSHGSEHELAVLASEPDQGESPRITGPWLHGQRLRLRATLVPGDSVPVHAAVDGFVARVTNTRLSLVHAGDVLAQLDDRQARARLREALDRREPAASPAEILALQEAIEQHVIRAPVDGMVELLSTMSVGRHAGPHTAPVALMHDHQHLRLEAAIAKDLFYRVKDARHCALVLDEPEGARLPCVAASAEPADDPFEARRKRNRSIYLHLLDPPEGLRVGTHADLELDLSPP
jgi:hypothetical protein